MSVKIMFTEDFATKEKGSELVCDSMLASQLVNKKKVAVYLVEPIELTEKENEALDSLEIEEAVKAEEAAQKGDRTLLDKLLGRNK